jgi:hypothetical protein
LDFKIDPANGELPFFPSVPNRVTTCDFKALASDLKYINIRELLIVVESLG